VPAALCAHFIYHAIASNGGEKMPEVYVHAIEGRTKEQKRALIKDITDAVVKNLDVTADAVLVEIIKSSRDNKAKGGVLFSER
jgi:4-oxalocrotonate tautomerase